MQLSKITKNHLGHIFATASGLAIPATAGTLGMHSGIGGATMAIGAVAATTFIGGLEILAKSDRKTCLNFMGSALISFGLFMDGHYAPPSSAYMEHQVQAQSSVTPQDFTLRAGITPR